MRSLETLVVQFLLVTVTWCAFLGGLLLIYRAAS